MASDALAPRAFTKPMKRRTLKRIMGVRRKSASAKDANKHLRDTAIGAVVEQVSSLPCYNAAYRCSQCIAVSFPCLTAVVLCYQTYVCAASIERSSEAFIIPWPCICSKLCVSQARMEMAMKRARTALNQQ